MENPTRAQICRFPDFSTYQLLEKPVSTNSYCFIRYMDPETSLVQELWVPNDFIHRPITKEIGK
jgi:hypothetical protein